MKLCMLNFNESCVYVLVCKEHWFTTQRVCGGSMCECGCREVLA